MRKSVSAVIGLAVAVALVGTACSDVAPTGPSLTRTGSARSNLLGLMAPIHRSTPLPADVTWSFTAGPLGATSTNSDVGLTIVIPAGALSSTQTITVTAPAGAPIAYKFEPHTVFNKNVSLTQDLTGTDGGLLGSLVMSGAHFATDDLQLNADGLALVDEVVPALLSILTNKATFKVQHFSGWILASGMCESDCGEDGAY